MNLNRAIYTSFYMIVHNKLIKRDEMLTFYIPFNFFRCPAAMVQWVYMGHLLYL